MMSSITRTSPWPGPLPYTLEEGKVFRGRKSEIEEIRRRVLTERLTILSGSSGVGKTSLIRAGVMWNLLIARIKSQEKYPQVPPILLLADWGVGQDLTVDELFSSRVAQAIRFLERWSPSDYASLSSVLTKLETDTSKSFFDFVVDICDSTDGVILILDQFEEVLRAGAEFADEAIRIVETIHSFERRARLLLSLRSEYHQELHGLENAVGGLYGRTYFLKPMIAKTVEEAIIQSAEAADVEIEESVVTTIVRWLQQFEKSETKQISTQVPTDNPSHATEPVVDLLTLQAILRELFDFCATRTPNEHVRIDKSALIDYMGKGHLPKSLDRLSEKDILEQEREVITRLVGEALERWINRSLDRKTALMGETPEIYNEPSQVLTGFVHRIAARMSPFLSSGTYKTAAEDLDLMIGALREDLQRLRPGSEQVDRRLWKISMEGTRPRFNRKALWPEEEIVGARRNLSGIAIKNGWSPAEAADQLAAVYKETQRRLEAGNILKPIHFKDDVRWELVHDKLGQPLNRLADKQKDTWEDAVFSLTVTRGSDIVITGNESRERIVNSMRWQGCWIIQQGNSALDGFCFEECNLQGTVFWQCTLKGVIFKRCLMDGVLFLNCQFENGDDGRPVTFDGCEGNGLAIMATPPPKDAEEKESVSIPKSIVHGLLFTKCNLSQTKFARLTLNGSIFIDGGTQFYLCDFAELRPSEENSNSGEVTWLEGSKALCCSWDESSQRFIDSRKAKSQQSGNRPDSYAEPKLDI